MVDNRIMLEPMMTKREVCDILRITRVHLEKLMRLGVIKYVDLASPGSKQRTARFKRSDIEALIDSAEIERATDPFLERSR